MNQGQLLSIQILPETENPAFEQRESGVTHSPYMQEVAFLSLIQQGNAQAVQFLLAAQEKYGIVIGRLSDHPLRQMQYWAVCCITLATRYAIQGGLDEMTAFNLSDSHIMRIDKFINPGEIIPFLTAAVVELTKLVQKSAHKNCPAKIRKCMLYIDQNLHTPIRIERLAQHVELSEDYLAKLFRKHTGKTVREYIMDKRLGESKALLRNGRDTKDIAYDLGFCSQTYFISCFKKAFGVTPRQYADSVE